MLKTLFFSLLFFIRKKWIKRLFLAENKIDKKQTSEKKKKKKKSLFKKLTIFKNNVDPLVQALQ
jgi:hypothetical protein